ncbi:MAG: family 20 glycosylhydrolase [Bacteroidales bacterium]
MKTAIVKLLVISAVMNGCAKKESGAPLEVRWEMGENLPDGTYSNAFVLINRSDREFVKDWDIRYSQLPRKIFQEASAPIGIEQITGDYFRMFPTNHFQGLKPGDSLRISFRANNGLIKESHAPAGMYLVEVTKGVEGKPIQLPVTVVPFQRPEQWTRHNVKEAPYPDGAYMFALNERIIRGKPAETDMIPGLKEVTTGSDTVVIPDVIAIETAEGLAKEGEMLGEKLTTLYRAKIDNRSSFKIKLSLLPVSAQEMNPEYYQMDIQKGEVLIKGVTAHAVFNGTQTFLNLLKGKGLPCSLHDMRIGDYPDLLYRGQMLDVARNFTKKENVLHLIDLLASYKINTIHLHLIDDEGWRLEIPGLEELTEAGARRGHTNDEKACLYPAYGSGPFVNDPTSAGSGFYTREDFKEILRYATDRHMRVITEVDMPGHSRAAVKAMLARYDKFIAQDSVKATEYLLTEFDDLSDYHSVQDYTDNVISVALPSTYRFIEKVITEIKKMYAEAGAPLEEIHIGGDEVPEGAWKDATLAKELMKQENITDVHDLNGYFFNRVNEIAMKHGLKIAGWQELAFASGSRTEQGNEAGFGNLYCWNTMPGRGLDMVPYMLANSGYDVILSNVNNLYFDLAYNRHQSEPGLHWGGYVDEVSSFNVLPYSIYKSIRTDEDGNQRDLSNADEGKVLLTSDGRKHIKGIQGQLWSENIPDYSRVQYMLFPKLFGLAERAWNASPEWGEQIDDKLAEAAYLQDLSKYYNQINGRELPYLSQLGVDYHVGQPGIRIFDNELTFNSIDPDAKIYYTLDGTTPGVTSKHWDGKPIILFSEAPKVRAIAVVRGKKSKVTRL